MMIQIFRNQNLNNRSINLKYIGKKKIDQEAGDSWNQRKRAQTTSEMNYVCLKKIQKSKIYMIKHVRNFN